MAELENGINRKGTRGDAVNPCLNKIVENNKITQRCKYSFEHGRHF